MKLLVLVAVLEALTHARPEAGSPPSPSTSYGAPGGGGRSGDGAVAGGGGSGFGGGVGGGALIQKQIYLHDSTAEPNEVRPQGPIVPATAPQKHYVTFNKAPSPTIPTTIIPTLPAEDEQRTFRYMLVKKPEEAPEITIPTPASTQPSKREICFTCYKTQKEDGGVGISGVTGIGDRIRFAREADENSSGRAAGYGIGTKVKVGYGGIAGVAYDLNASTLITYPPVTFTYIIED